MGYFVSSHVTLQINFAPKLRSNIHKNNSPGVREDLGSPGVPVGIRVRNEALLGATKVMFTPTASDEFSTG